MSWSSKNKMGLTKTEEDYLEAIYSIITEKGYIRVKDIAKDLAIKPPSVSEMLGKLRDKGLVNYEEYSGITLTKKGERIGKAIKTRHNTIKKFLQIILIPEEIAEKNACDMEHHLDPRTIEQLTKFVQFVERAPPNPKWLEHFGIYCKKGEVPECDQRD